MIIIDTFKIDHIVIIHHGITCEFVVQKFFDEQ